MHRFLPHSILLLLALAAFSVTASANQIAVGLLSLDATTGSSGEFDITNGTGTNSFAPFFPVTTSLTFSVTSLTLNFTSGPAVVLTGSNFTSDGSGGWLGLNSFNLVSNPITSAVLVGTISPTTGISVSGSGTENISADFEDGSGHSSVSLTDASGNLATGDSAVIYAGPAGATTTTPEPQTDLLFAAGLACILGLLLRRRNFVQRRQG